MQGEWCFYKHSLKKLMQQNFDEALIFTVTRAAAAERQRRKLCCQKQEKQTGCLYCLRFCIRIDNESLLIMTHCKWVTVMRNFCVSGNGQSLYYCSKSCQLKEWKQHQVLCKTISQLITERKEKLHKADVYNTTLALPEKDQKMSS